MVEVEPSSLRPWQEQLVQHLKTGRLRYLHRIAVVCAALEPRPSLPDHHQQASLYPPSTSSPTQSTPNPSPPPPTSSPVNSQDSVVHKHGRLYIPNPFLLPTLHTCVLCLRRRSFTLKRILAGITTFQLLSTFLHHLSCIRFHNLLVAPLSFLVHNHYDNACYHSKFQSLTGG